MSETTVTAPVEGGRRRTTGEIHDALNEMLVGPEEHPEQDSSTEEQPSPDSSDEIEEQQDIELADDSVVDEQDDEGPEEEQLDSDTPVYRITVDGEDMEVPLDELISGYHRTATFTKKSAALGEERAQFQQQVEAFGAHQNALMQERQEYSGVLEQLRQQMESAAQPPDFDWDRLEREDPVQFLKLKVLERDRQEQVQAVQVEQQRMMQVQQQQAQQDMQKRLAGERTMVLERIPEWSDADLQADEQRKLLEYGKTLGFSDEELAQVYDHRALVALRDAWRYNELVNGKKVTTAKSKIGSATPGNKETSRRTRSRKQKAMRQKLRDTGKVDDAAALLGAMLTD